MGRNSARAMGADEMVGLLDGVQEGTPIFVSYLVGREPTERAIREAQRAVDEGFSLRHFTGKFQRVWTSSKGDPILTVLCDTRDSERTGKQEAYRSFNPNLGKLLTVEVLQ